MNKSIFFFIVLFFPKLVLGQTQDTVKISLQDFIQRGIENSGQVKYQKQKVNLAENRVDQIRAQRFLPKFDLNTQHGVVPGVKSNTNLPDDEYYLDPNLKNDWGNWAIYTRADVTAIQPIFSWGALKSAVQAAKSAAVAAQAQFQGQKADIRIKLFDLYQSYKLTSELLNLLDEAQDKIKEIQNKIDEKKKEKDSDIDESDIFKFKVYQSEFDMQAAEVRKNAETTQRIWNYVLQAKDSTVYVPDSFFLDPVSQKLKALDYYRMNALSNRSEISAIQAGINAAKFGLKATKMKNYPTLFLGLTGSYANTPNRPRQSNPFIINSTNYASAAVGFGIRQNLDFLSMKADVDKSRIQYKEAKYLKDAAVDGIVLDINEAYKDASLSKVKVDKTNDALVTSKKWLRQEQLDFDFGIGKTKDLIDAMKKELELRVQLKRQTFEYNKNMAELYRKSGLPIMEIVNKD
ncbi:MAG TPA: TolC family protein [Balneolaceae bacterium]|nr:TolC family protein [Balneolaceae bacterium]